MASLNRTFDRLQPELLTVSRVLLGVVFFWHGLSKFRNGIGGVEAAFEEWGVPVPLVTALAVAAIELIGGLALIAGLGSRIAAAALTLVMIGALVFVKFEMGITGGANTDLGLVAGLLAIVGFGPGPDSTDVIIGLERPSEDRVASAP